MKGKKLVVLAVVVGAIAVILVNVQFSRLEKEANPENLAIFYRALRDLDVPMKVSEALDDRDPYLEAIEGVPDAFAKALPNAIDKKALDRYTEQEIVRPLRAGGILRIEHLQDYSKDEITHEIPAGMLAVAVRVERESAVGFLATPGDHVDVYLVQTRPDERTRGGVVVEVSKVASRVLILAVDGHLRGRQPDAQPRRGDPYETVTLAGMPDQVTDLLEAAERGKLTLAIPAPERGN